MTNTKSKKSLPENVFSLFDVAKDVALLDLISENKKLKKNQKDLGEMAVRSILHALDCKDHYTYGHSTRVTYYALMLGRKMGLTEKELYDLEIASLCHDIGKIGIPDAILLKTERLNEKEFQIMKGHPSKSAGILENFKPFKRAAKYAKHHHERYDGKGYPDALKGENIPLLSRMILIADSFDAMTSTRPYRKGLPYKVAFEDLQEFSGSQFDPLLVKSFCRVMTFEEKKQENTFQLTIVPGIFKKAA